MSENDLAAVSGAVTDNRKKLNREVCAQTDACQDKYISAEMRSNSTAKEMSETAIEFSDVPPADEEPFFSTVFLLRVYHHVDYGWQKRPLLCQDNTANLS